jgi:glycosyltransferase involved in cell wall biosynthesis
MIGRDILIMSLQNWGDTLGSNSYNLAMEFAKKNRVLYVNRAPDRITQFKNFIQKDKKQSKTDWISNPLMNLYVLDTQTVMESINWLPPKLFQYFNFINGKKLSKEIKKATIKLGMSNLVLFIDNDFIRGLYLKDLLSPDVFIYYIRDNLRTHHYFGKHGQQCEEQIAVKADLIVANSNFLAELLKPLNANSHDIGQGCNFDLFKDDEIEKPAEFPRNEQPNIGYIGNIVSYRLDLSMLELICDRRKDWNWIFIGPEDTVFQKSKLHDLPNVYFLGIKKENELWKYMQHIDVCINPQLKNGMTEGNYPRKIDEYLYMGKAVVATNTDFMRNFSNYVYLFNNITEFEHCIEEALDESSDFDKISTRRRLAADHSWKNCTEKIYTLIQN